MRKVLCAAALLLTPLAHGEDLSSPSDRAVQRAAATPTVHLLAAQQGCNGSIAQVMAVWGGNATSYELRYNGVVLATSTAPSEKLFNPGSREFTLTLKGCKAGVCKTTSRVVRTSCGSGSGSVFDSDL